MNQMKQPRIFNVAFLLACVLLVREGRAQDYPRWNLPEGALARLGKGGIGGGDRAVTFSPDGTRLAVASTIGIWLYDAHTSAEIALFTGHTGSVNSVAFSPDGTLLASGSDGRSFDITVVLWDVASGQEIAAIQGHGDRVNSVAFSPDGTTPEAALPQVGGKCQRRQRGGRDHPCGGLQWGYPRHLHAREKHRLSLPLLFRLSSARSGPHRLSVPVSHSRLNRANADPVPALSRRWC